MSDTWATAAFDEKPLPNAHIQWKGTDVCLDFRCTCGYQGHFDGDFAYALACAGCGLVWTTPHTFGLLPDGDESEAVLPEDPWKCTLAAPTSPSEPVPSTPRVPGSTERPEGILAVRQEWRVSGVADDKVYGKDHYWERIYEERARVDEHVDWLSRAYPEATAQVHRRTITTFTGEWMEETNDAD